MAVIGQEWAHNNPATLGSSQQTIKPVRHLKSLPKLLLPIRMPKHQNDLSEGFDPTTLIEAVRAQAPEFPWLPEVLSKCGVGLWESRAYVRYVDRRNANQSGAEWQFKTNVVLSHETLGTVVLDVLKDNRLGGIEFVDKI